jgi:hypothetical protein
MEKVWSRHSALYAQRFWTEPLGINWDVCRNDYPNTRVEANIFNNLNYCTVHTVQAEVKLLK